MTQKIKRIALSISLILICLKVSVATAADCATFPSRVAIHHGIDLPQQTQLKLMQALKFDCSDDLALSDIASVIEMMLTQAGIVIDDVEPFTLSAENETGEEC